jgi:hypothetical protein
MELWSMDMLNVKEKNNLSSIKEIRHRKKRIHLKMTLMN